MSKYKKLAKNSAIYAIGSFGSRFISVLMLPFYTELLSQSDYGQIDIITTTLGLLIPIFTVNIVEGVLRFSLDKENYNYSEVITNSIVFIITGFILMICIYPLVSKINFINEFAYYFYSLFLIQALHTSIKQFTRAIDLSKAYMLSDLLYTFSFVVFNIIFLLFLNLGIEGYIISMILAYILDLSFLSQQTKIIKYLDIKCLNKEVLRNMSIYCMPLIPNSIMWWIMNISDRYILIYFMGLGANGLYAVASKFAIVVSNINTIFFRAWQISAVEEYNSEDKNEFYSNIFNIFCFIMIILTSLYISFNKPIINLLVSNEFYESWKYAPILVLGSVFSSFSSFIGTNYVAMKKTIGAFYTSLLGALINFLLNLFLIPILGIYGASIATLISSIIVWVLRIVDTRKFVKIKYPLLRMFVSLTLIASQIIIGYLEINFWVNISVNLLILLTIIFLGYKFIKKPIVFLYKNVLQNAMHKCMQKIQHLGNHIQ
jgi:O-antigen/teichoic acid export membrane protein